MTIIVSKREQRVVVLRNGIEIGRSVAEIADDDPGTHLVTLTRDAAGKPQWIYVGLPGHASEEGHEIDESVINRIHLPRRFYEAVRSALKPGTTILITNAAVGTSPGEPLTVLDAVAPQP